MELSNRCTKGRNRGNRKNSKSICSIWFLEDQKVDQEEFFELNNCEKFDENDKFGLIDYLSRYPNQKALNILKKEISKDREKKEEDTTTQIVLVALALSQLGEEDAIDVILENSHDLIN